MDLKQPLLTNNLARPFLKWAGGKHKLLAQYQEYIPKNFKSYYEPFLGGGAIFFYLSQRNNLNATLTDINENLIEVYRCVKFNLKELISLLEEHEYNHNKSNDQEIYKAYYYQIRDHLLCQTPIERAARIIYLNRTCWNGLYRENSQGKFNVPLGKYKNPKICQHDLLIAASKALQNAEIATRDFTQVLNYATKGDFVYFDPPYYPISNTSYFTAYSRDCFNKEDQEKLKDIVVALDKMGVKVMISNSDCEAIRELYKDLKIYNVSATRTLNSNLNKRGKIGELLITNY